MGLAIEAGLDEQEARRRVNAGEFTVTAAGAAVGGVVGGGAVAAATGLGGVGLAFGGGAVGIGALTAVAAPAVAGAAVGYVAVRGVASSIRGIQGRNRERTLRTLIEHFTGSGQAHKAVRLFEIEGKGSLLDGRSPPTNDSAKALLEVLERSESDASVGLFCSPLGQFVVTFDLDDGRYGYVILVDDDEFLGGGIDSRGEEFDLKNHNSSDLLIERLEREGFLRFPDNSDEESQ